MSYGHSEERMFDPDMAPPEARYGDDLIPAATDTDEDYAVITMEIPWDLVKDRVTRPPKHVAFVEGMSLDALQSLEADVPPVSMVMGIGGGSSHDSAKYVAIKRDARLVQVPTIISGDASVTDAVGIRDGWKVTYIGHAVCDSVIVDFSVLRQAPERLVRYGAGDVLSSHTALHDWRVACEAGQAEFDQEFYDLARAKLARLHDMRFAIRDLTDDGIRTIIELYRDYALIACRLGNDRCQEGSEHFVAYNAEYVTRRSFLHGGLLAMGIFVMTYLQDNEHDETTRFMRDMGLAFDLDTVGLSRDEFVETMRSLKDFVRKGGYYHSAVDEMEITAPQIEELVSRLT